MSARDLHQATQLDALWRARPRDHFARGSVALAVALMMAAWLFGGFDWAEFTSARRAANLERFLVDVRPFPLQGHPWDWGVAWSWARDLFEEKGRSALIATLGISILAIVLAAASSLLLSFPAARNFARASPFLAAIREPSRAVDLAWRAGGTSLRLALLLLRSIPEYVLAFLLLAIFGPTPWTAILALALHNLGVLGRLGAETIENIPPASPRALRSAGASRLQIAVWSLMPELLPRWLLYFFYRWESCVREATVLGLLGIVSIGFWIDDARTRGRTDELAYFVFLGVAIILLGSALSTLARSWLRRTT